MNVASVLPFSGIVCNRQRLCAGRAVSVEVPVPEEGQSIWSKRRQGFQSCCEAGIRELTLLMPEPAVDCFPFEFSKSLQRHKLLHAFYDVANEQRVL